ncbi:uncharacterized protein LOC21399872 [Morus notabilis]|uniref:uncharacterized protein LOC21399872 n=1 Tax=Morus notabilis TaxID=981085 RepID=UPI000CECE62A|nr:uncharacterized protein LOC21399872 [Morus notabilis]
MGSCLSCRSSSSELEFKAVRVVHLNGYVEDFEHPVSVSYVTGKPTKYFVCTPAQLLSCGTKPMRPETLLERGKLYFLLPYSALQADVSPLDLASIARKLTALAKTVRRKPNKSPGRFSPSPAQYGGSSPDTTSIGVQRAVRERPWKPILDTIRERSFTRRSESELQLQENQIEALRVA